MLLSEMFQTTKPLPLPQAKDSGDIDIVLKVREWHYTDFSGAGNKESELLKIADQVSQEAIDQVSLESVVSITCENLVKVNQLCSGFSKTQVVGISQLFIFLLPLTWFWCPKGGTSLPTNYRKKAARIPSAELWGTHL